jgi:glycosyltransferase involved in cell wall biosynthesis
LFVQHGRQHWKDAHLNTTKGNDRFLKGFAEFVKKRPDYKVKIVFFQYGEDVANTKLLAQELGIGDYIIWAPLMQRKQLLNLLANADLGIGYWTHDTWLLYCTIVEFMFINVPVIGFRDDAYYRGKNIDLFPMLSANTTHEIADRLTEFSDKIIDTKAMATDAKAWLFHFNLTQFKKNIEGALASKKEKQISTLSNWTLRLLPLKLNFLKFLNIVKIKISIK